MGSKILFSRRAPRRGERGTQVETVGLETGRFDVLESVESAAAVLGRHKSVPEVAEAALDLSLSMTQSSLAFVALIDEDGERRIFSRSADPLDRRPATEIEKLLTSTHARQTAGRSSASRDLEVGGVTIGTLGVACPTGYTALQQRLFTLLAAQVAMALGLALQGERRQKMVDTLVNLRAELDRSERQRLVNEERVRSAARVEQAHEAAVDALLAVSRHARTGHSLSDFYRRLTGSIAELVAARKVLFWQVNDEHMLNPIAGAYGIDDAFLARLTPTPCAPDLDDVASRVVYHDLMFRAARSDEPGSFDYVLDALKVQNAIAVPWRAGDQRLGLVAAYDSRRSEGFSREDSWVLQKAGLAAGLVWQLRYADTDLKKTVERLQKVDAARQLLLKNVSTAVEKARRRFAGDLHDDALQKLTAAELQLQRLRDPSGDTTALLDEAQDLLMQTEEALRRLLFEVRPQTLEVPGGFEETIRERIAMLKSLTGAEVHAEVDIPKDLSYDFRSMLYRQLTEAIANVEKHAAATRVNIGLNVRDGGVHGVVQDNGRGFVVAERERLPGHLGLLALNERALLAGGWNKTLSEPGAGTTIEFWLPWAEEKV
jgi:signal transduction histidine kinase